MERTPSAAFNTFSSNIALTPNQRTNVNARATRVKELLATTFPSSNATPLVSASLMGSCDRQTAIRPLNDLDVLAVFSNKESVWEHTYQYDSQAFLYWIRQKINAKTTVENVGARGQAVRLFYQDNLHVDIAPVFQWHAGGYILPAGDGSWILTDPYKQAVWANEREATLNNRFRRRVRMLKQWNAAHGKRLGSWHLEAMVGAIFTGMGDNSRTGTMRFFEWAPGHVHVQDPDGFGGDLAAKLTREQIAAILGSFQSNHDRAVKAVEAEARGNLEEAIRLWRIVFGNDFPAYG